MTIKYTFQKQNKLRSPNFIISNYAEANLLHVKLKKKAISNWMMSFYCLPGTLCPACSAAFADTNTRHHSRPTSL